MCAIVDADNIAKDNIVNPEKRDETASVNPIHIPKKQVEYAIFNPEDKVYDASSNKFNHNTSTNLKTFEKDMDIIYKDYNKTSRNIYEAVHEIYFEEGEENFLMSSLIGIK